MTNPQDALVKSALELFGATASAAFLIPVPNTTPPIFIAGGERGQITKLLDPHCQCPACIGGMTHASDCAVHGVDTDAGIVRGDCDCGVPTPTASIAQEEPPLSANQVIDALVTALREIEWSKDTTWQSQRARDVLWDNHYLPEKYRPHNVPASIVPKAEDEAVDWQPEPSWGRAFAQLTLAAQSVDACQPANALEVLGQLKKELQRLSDAAPVAQAAAPELSTASIAEQFTHGMAQAAAAEADELARSIIRTLDLYIGHKPTFDSLCDDINRLARIFLARPETAPVAWLFECRKPGHAMRYASIEEQGTEHWPIDQWRSIIKTPLAPISEADADRASGGGATPEASRE